MSAELPKEVGKVLAYLHIYMHIINDTYLHIQNMQYDSISLHKGKMTYKVFVWNQASFLLNELIIFISNLHKGLAYRCSVCFTTVSTVFFSLQLHAAG